MALALNNLKRVDMPLNKETKPNQTTIVGKSGTLRNVYVSVVHISKSSSTAASQSIAV